MSFRFSSGWIVPLRSALLVAMFFGIIGFSFLIFIDTDPCDGRAVNLSEPGPACKTVDILPMPPMDSAKQRSSIRPAIGRVMVDHFHLSTGLVAARTDLAIAKAQLHEDVTFDATDGRMDLGARMWQAKTRIELGERHVRRLKRELKEARRSVRSVADDLATR